MQKFYKSAPHVCKDEQHAMCVYSNWAPILHTTTGGWEALKLAWMKDKNEKPFIPWPYDFVANKKRRVASLSPLTLSPCFLLRNSSFPLPESWLDCTQKEALLLLFDGRERRQKERKRERERAESFFVGKAWPRRHRNIWCPSPHSLSAERRREMLQRCYRDAAELQ